MIPRMDDKSWRRGESNGSCRVGGDGTTRRVEKLYSINISHTLLM